MKVAMLNLKDADRIKVEGYRGTWHTIDTYQSFLLLEHDYYGDETCLLLVHINSCKWDDEKERFYFTSECMETWDDIFTAIDDYRC